MTQKVNAPDIKLGMFIADLDRPWIDTPFLLQGFLIEDEGQIRQLRDLCKWVLIDPQRSVGPEYSAPVKKVPIPRRDLGSDPRVSVNRTTTPVTTVTSGKSTVAGAPARGRATAGKTAQTRCWPGQFPGIRHADQG
ncbi:MAG: DUF3391 domain-containing protein [Betaproteobacteria bacterium]|nr:DUF3391 domain-containing protein [Betaproteobacteria bacterium]